MARHRSFSILIVFILHCLSLPLVIASITNITTDQHALLALKARITHDPSNLLTNNWSASTPVNNWVGITCGHRHGRVTALNISYFNLTGTIPPQLGNLSFLASLAIRNNSFYGTLPDDLVQLRRLKYIDFVFNNFNIEIPSWFGSLPKLQHLLLNDNNFAGNIPPSLGNISTLQQLNLSANQLSGDIPEEIGNLTKLRGIYLGYNDLRGEIPNELGNLVELEELSLGGNALTGLLPSLTFNLSSLINLDLAMNKLTGSLPDNMCQHLPILQELSVMTNNLTGPIPDSLWECRELRVIVLSYNQFSGSISRKIGNLTLANTIDLSFNNLTGQIPPEIGNLPNLKFLRVGVNILEGTVPATLFNISTMIELSLPGNNLSGSIPSSIDLGLPNLERFCLSKNHFNRKIPSSITNMSKLTNLELSENSFSGFIPNTIGNLRSLKCLSLFDNYLSTPDLAFLSSLTNCKNLRALQLSANPLNGILPSSIGNLSVSLEIMDMKLCNITGNIPEEIGKLKNLMVLNLEENELFGSIPVALGRLRNLQSLFLGRNKLDGFIPDSICHLNRLVTLGLGGNKLFGSIPACLGNLTTLTDLSLASNRLTSIIPSSMGKLEDILYFNLSSNSLHGPLPANIENLKAVLEIDLSRNQLSGYIPTTFSGLEHLQFLSLGNNRLKGPIPKLFGNLLSLEALDLSNNELSGVIPNSLEKLVGLQHLNLSFNRLEGQIPTGGPFTNFSAESFLGNHGLCGPVRLQHPPCETSTKRNPRIKTILLLVILPLSIALIVLVLALKLVLLRIRKGSKLPNNGDLSLQEMWRRISYFELLRSTNGFAESNLLGIGSFGSVYYGRLTDGLEVAVKVFHLQLEAAFKSFDDEGRLMSCIRHRNLVKVISSCSNDGFKALVLEYMPNGSLEKYLHSNNFFLDILTRLNIMIDVASALEYLHFGYSTPILHCDLKPSNVLLDRSMVAHLSDFGIAKLLGEGQSMTQTQTLATIGYMAPEYGREGKVSRKGDVYSYGIMLMETFTGKKPTDEIFCGEMSLKTWVNEALHNSIIEVVDTNLLRREDEHFAEKEQCISSIFNVAMECTRESREERISMKEVVSELLKIRAKMLANTATAGSISLSNLN